MALFHKQQPNNKFVIDYAESNAQAHLCQSIDKLKNLYSFRHWVVVCIGTDRSTGDSLGPLVGSKLKLLDSKHITVLGTLEEPVHALNLEETISYIQSSYRFSGIIAIDASLGQLSSVGTIQVVNGPLKPGAGVQKDLPEIGHFHITGIVNVGGFMEYFVLQNTRLSVVMRMAETISSAVHDTLSIDVFKKGNAAN